MFLVIFNEARVLLNGTIYGEKKHIAACRQLFSGRV
jgi:hypothetical protein